MITLLFFSFCFFPLLVSSVFSIHFRQNHHEGYIMIMIRIFTGVMEGSFHTAFEEKRGGRKAGIIDTLSCI